MHIRKARIEDIPQMVRVYSAARHYMRSVGNMHQWSDSYPGEDSALSDIEEGGSYVCEDESGRICVTFFLRLGEDPSYKRIYEGKWLTDNDYGVIHRVASDGTVKDVMRQILDFCFQFTDEIRIDTHRDNHTMQNCLLRYGFKYCGIIYLLSGDERLAYQMCK